VKKIVYILLVGLSLILIISFGFFIEITLNKRANNAPVTESSTATVMVKGLSPTQTGTSMTSTPLPDYEILSPNKIKKDKLIFDVSAQLLTCAELEIQVNGTFPPGYVFPSSNLEDHGLSILNDLDITTSSSNISLKLAPSFGGGGGSDTNNVHIIGEGLAYLINPPLNVGQELHVTAVVTFNKLFNIVQPVPFNLDVVAQQC
jgi:uncharacterized protein YneF (UPF0154 family)